MIIRPSNQVERALKDFAATDPEFMKAHSLTVDDLGDFYFGIRIHLAMQNEGTITGGING